MSALDDVRLKFKVDRRATSKGPLAGSAGAAPTHIDFVGLTPAQEEARTYVLRELKANPDVQRAFVSRFEAGNLIVTLGLRGVGTADLLIPADRFDAKSIHHFQALMSCLTLPSEQSKEVRLTQLAKTPPEHMMLSLRNSDRAFNG